MNRQNRPPSLPPYLLVSAIGRIRSFLLSLHKKMFPGSVVLYEQFQNLWILPSLYVAAELDVAGHLKDKTISVEELSTLTATDCDSLYRVLRALAGTGIFRERPGRLFSNTASSKALIDGEGSIRNVIRHHLGNVNWRTLGNLMHTVKTGENSFQHLNGVSIYQFLEQNKGDSILFGKSMTDLSNLSLAPLIQGYDFSKFHTIADIGGGEGQFLASLLLSAPWSTGILFDLPEATHHANKTFESAGVSERVKIITGDFYKSFDVTADLYILKNVIHNWSDENAVSILLKIRDAMPPKARILIIDMMIMAGPGNPLPKLLDVQMLASFSGGKERTRDEFIGLLDQAGLNVRKFIPTVSSLYLIESVKK